MKSKMSIKIIIDILMTALIFFLMGYHLWGDQAHEWGGASLGVLFIVHQVLNWSWYKNLFKGRYDVQRILQTVVNALLMIMMIGLLYSGIVMSHYVVDFQPANKELFFARQLHMLLSYWGFVLVSLHLGIHWNMLLKILKKRIDVAQPSKLRSLLLFAIGLLIAVYGITAVEARNFIDYLFMQAEFVFLDFSEPKLQFYLDYLSVMGLIIFLVLCISKILPNIENQYKNLMVFLEKPR